MEEKRCAHLICNAHIDPVWLWEKEEGLATALSTFRIAADFCEEYDGFIFNHNEALLYDFVRVTEPELFARIQRLVKEGKWQIMGGWYVQPDCNLPSGESFVRQIITGREFFKKYFDCEPRTAINFDPFGHTRSLVQLLAKSGFDSYLHTRPNPTDCPLPSEEYIWVGFDGSEVIGRRCWEGYGHAEPGELANKIMVCLALFHPEEKVVPVLWGIGDHGGGPSRIDMEKLQALIAEHPELEILHSSTDMYFDELRQRRDELPRYEGSLNFWAAGCYTSMIRIKQKHRRLENRLYMAEKMSTHAALFGIRNYEQGKLDRAMQDLLFCEFHDILPGSCIRPGEERALMTLDHGLEEAETVRYDSFMSMLVGQPAAKEGDLPIFVYNPHPYPVDTVMNVEYQMPVSNWDKKFTVSHLFDENGNEILSQAEMPTSNLAIDWRKNTCFVAHLNPAGITRFDCRFSRVDKQPRPTMQPADGYYTVVTDRMVVKINASTGLVDSYMVDGVEQVENDAFCPLVIKDTADSWGMNSTEFRQVVGRFSCMSQEDADAYSGFVYNSMPAVRVVEEGPVRVVIEALMEYHRSTAVLRYGIPKQGASFTVDLEVVWNEPTHMLKLAVPLKEHSGQCVAQAACGREEMPSTGRECVMQKWVAVCGQHQALTVVNNGVYAFDYDQKELRLTLLRSPGYSVHPLDDREWRMDDHCHPHIDLGERRFSLEVTAGDIKERMEVIEREAQLFNERPYAVNVFPSGAPGEKVQTLIRITGDDAVVMVAFKRAMDGNGYILRLFEPTGSARTATIEIPALHICETVCFTPFELKSFRVSESGLLPCLLTEIPC